MPRAKTNLQHSTGTALPGQKPEVNKELTDQELEAISAGGKRRGFVFFGGGGGFFFFRFRGRRW